MTGEKKVRVLAKPTEPSTAWSLSDSSTSLTKAQQCRLRCRERFTKAGYFLFDKHEKTCCRRNCKSWGFILLFYLIFLGGLFGAFFCALYILVVAFGLRADGPFYSKSTLVSERSPALGMVPRLTTSTAPLIWYTTEGEDTPENVRAESYVTAIDTFLKTLDKPDKRRYIDCAKKVPKDGEYCSFTRDHLGPCGVSTYGYQSQKPCVYLKLNMNEDWKPSRKRKKHYNILRITNENNTIVDEDQDEDETIPVKCGGISSFDSEHMGNVSLYPESGFSYHFFPYDGSVDYIRPLVAVQFENLRRGLVIGVKCSIAEIENMKDPLLHTISIYFFIPE